MKYTIEEVKFIRQKKKEQREYKKAILEKGDQLQKLLDEGKLIKHENNNSVNIISTCLGCGSNDISIEEDISYDCDECPYVDGYYLKCNCCGEINYN